MGQKEQKTLGEGERKNGSPLLQEIEFLISLTCARH